MKFDIYFLRVLGSAFISYSLIYFIVLRMFKNTNNMKRCIISLIIGGSLVVINLVGFGVDYIAYGLNKDNISAYISAMYPYFAFPLLALVSLIVVPLVFFIIAKKHNQHLGHDFKYYSKLKEKEQKSFDKEAKQTIYDNDDYLYLVLKYDGKFLLKEVTNKEGIQEYSGLVIKFDRGQNFQDEFLNKVINQLELDVNESKLIGKVYQKKNDNKNKRYYVYILDLNSISNHVEDLKGISPIVMYNCNLSNFNKQVLFHVVLNEYFEINL